jgi:photosystem II stability/assembly factor-like uncharacterized protein
VAGYTSSANFPRTVGSLQQSKSDFTDGFVAKLSPTGSTLVYSTYLGGDNIDQIFSLALNAAGEVFVAGRSDSKQFPTAGISPVNSKTGSPAYRTLDGGSNWSRSDNGLTRNIVTTLASDPTNPNLIYAGTGAGIFKSTDGGSNWQLAGTPSVTSGPVTINVIAIDPTNTNVVYAATNGGIFKSTDGGNSFTEKSKGLTNFFVTAMSLAPSAPSTLYAGTASTGFYKSTDGAESWVRINNGYSNSAINKLVIDPTNSAIVYAATSRGVYKTTNGGTNWSPANTGLVNTITPNIGAIAIDPSAPSTL